MKAEVKCSLCNRSLGVLEDPQAEETVEIFKKHLPEHKLAEIYDFSVRNASQLFPSIIWDYGSKNSGQSQESIR